MAETVKKGARITGRVIDGDGSPGYLAAGAQPPPVEGEGDAPPATTSAEGAVEAQPGQRSESE